MKRGIAGLALLTVGGFAHGMSWADLWSRPDQQTIAQRQQAYAEIQGRQYAAAAQHLQPFTDPVSQYNRGNALAHGSDLPAALAAYDAVLHDPRTAADLQQDARHNRDLVEQQLKSQQQPDNKKGGKDSQRGDGSKDSDSSRDGDSAKNGKDTKGDQDTNGDKGAIGDKASSADGNPAGAKPAEQQDAGRGELAQDARQAPEPPPSSPQSPAAQGQANPADLRAGNAPPPPTPEQVQSLDQWLRWIPDDPAGLLRRKFMIEHMLHQNGAKQ